MKIRPLGKSEMGDGKKTSWEEEVKIKQFQKTDARGKRSKLSITSSYITIPWPPGRDHVIDVNAKSVRLLTRMLSN